MEGVHLDTTRMGHAPVKKTKTTDESKEDLMCFMA